MILHRATHIRNTEELSIYKCIYYTRRTPMVVIQSADKKKQENADTKSHADEEAQTGKREHTWGILLLKKKKVHTSWAVSALLLGCICFPFRNTTWNPVSSLLSFIQPQIVRAGEEAVSQRSDSSAIGHAFGLQRCRFLSILSCSPGSSLQSNFTT